MAQPKVIRPRPKDGSEPVHLPTKTGESLSRDKKILPGRRQQRHSTEIGSEYHRWWVVRNVLGFETNEHIAGLLLDGFHSVLEQLVGMTGGQMFNPEIHGLDTVDSHSQSSGSGDVASTSQSSSSPFATSPPGYIEDMEEFIHYKSTIGYYCEYLWTLCIQQNRMQPVLHGLSPPIQQFLIKLIGYIRTAKAKSETPSTRRKRSRNSSSKQADSTDKVQVQQSKAECSTSPHRDKVATESTNSSEAYGSKLDLNNHFEGLNNQKQTQDSSPDWKFHPYSHSLKPEDLVGLHRNLKQMEQLSTDGSSVGVNTSYNAESRSEGGRKENTVNFPSSRYWDTPTARQAFGNLETNQFESWNSPSGAYSSAKGGGVEQLEDRRKSHGTGQKWKHKIYNDDIRNGKRSSAKVDEEEDWSRFHATGMGDKTEDGAPVSAPNSCPSSVPSTPHVYLDCDVDQTMEPETSLETLTPLPDDHCLKSLLSRPLKVQSVDTPQFVKEDGTVWHGFQHSRREMDTEINPSRTKDELDKKSPGSGKMQNPQKCSENPHLTPTDLSFRPDSRGSMNTSKSSQTSTANSLSFLGSVPRGMSSAPATLVYAGSANGQPHPLGTPVFLYPAGRFPTTADNSLASLPALVQNIVYNQSGASMLQPIAERPCTPAVSNAFSSALSMVNRGPGKDTTSGPPAFVPLYMHGPSRVDTGYNKPSHVVNTSASNLPGNMSLLSSTSKKSASGEIPADLVNDLPSSTKLYQDWTTASGYQLLSSLGTKESASNRSPQFQITDVRSCEDFDFTKTGPQHGSNNFTATHGFWWQENKIHERQDKTVVSNVQGLSGRKLNIVADLRDSATSGKITSHVNCSGNQYNQAGHNSSRHTGAQVYYGNSNKYSSTGHSNGKHSFVNHGNGKHTSGNYCNRKHTETGQNVLSKHIVSSMDTSLKGKSNQAEQSQRPTSFSKKRQNSSTEVEELSDSSLKEEKRSRSSSGSCSDNPKMLQNEDQVSKKDSQRRGDPDIPHSNQGAKKVGQASKPRTPATPGSSSNRSSSRRHICQSCELVFPSGTDLLLHRYEQHSLVCGECDSRFLSSSGLLRHKETDHPPISRCPHCRFVTFSREEMAKHIGSEHSTISIDKSETPKFSSDNLGKKETVSDSTLMVNQERKWGSKALDSYRDAQAHPNPPNSLTSFKPEKDWPTQTKALPNSRGLSSPHGYRMSSEQDRNLAFEPISDVEAAVSESEEPSLVIDTSESVEPSRQEAQVSTTSSPDEQPLCLVVHSREHDRTEQQSTTTADQQGKSISKDQDCQMNRFTANEVKMGDNLVTPVISKAEKEETAATFMSEMECLQFLRNGKESRMPTKRTVSSSTIRGADVDNVSTACFTYCDASLDSVDRDSWSTGQLDGSGDGLTLSKSDVSRTNHWRSNPVYTHGPRKDHPQPKKTRSNSASNNAEDKGSLSVESATVQSSSREMALQDRHTLSSLPPKKRGFRKSPRHSCPNSSAGTRTLRGGNGQEKPTEVYQNKLQPGENSGLDTNSLAEGTQNGSSSVELAQTAKDTTTGSPNSTVLSVSVSRASKALRKKQTLSGATQRRRQRQHKFASGEARGLRRGELRNKGDLTQASKTDSNSAPTPHLVNKPVRSHKCPDPGCGASFSRKWTMEVHVDRIHRKEGHQLKCHIPQCSGKFSSRRELRKHVVEGHQGKVRRYTCSWPECGQSFFARTHLRTHTLVHTGEKPIACQLCDYRCRQRTALIWHMRKHGCSSSPQQESTKSSTTSSKSGAN